MILHPYHKRISIDYKCSEKISRHFFYDCSIEEALEALNTLIKDPHVLGYTVFENDGPAWHVKVNNEVAHG